MGLCSTALAARHPKQTLNQSINQSINWLIELPMHGASICAGHTGFSITDEQILHSSGCHLNLVKSRGLPSGKIARLIFMIKLHNVIEKIPNSTGM